jgi:hypothetical protein
LEDAFPFFSCVEEVRLAGEVFLTLVGMAGAFLSERNQKKTEFGTFCNQ